MQSQKEIGGIELEMPKIAIRGIKVYRSRGNLYVYHRATGTRIKSRLGTAEFFAELTAIEAKISEPT
jgi:hypothetical protein